MLLLLILFFFKRGILLHLSLPLIPTFPLLNEDKCFVPMQRACQLQILIMGFIKLCPLSK